ncbi:MAG: Ig-like domain-containing protein [Polyangiaceae bacterium]|nr:Ig-like domain-containing protein [Polyangiaceae bacterium]
MLRVRSIFAAATLASLPLLFTSISNATGMQGHMYMAMCAAEQVTDARLRAVFDGYPIHLANGAFLVDSGYTQEDHDQGEIPHWEGFIEAYVQHIRKTYAAPYDTPEASQHVANLMGMAAHGITDSTFDTLIYARAEQVEPSNMDSFDTAMDIFLVADMPRYFVPDFAYHSPTLSQIFTDVNHPVPVENVEKAASTARIGIAAVSELLYKGADDFGKKYPWGRANFLNPKTPGSYAFGAKVVMGYYRELLKRLDGDTSADEVVIGTYPSADNPMVTLDSSRPDGKVILFFGAGIDRNTLPANIVTILGPDGMEVPAQSSVFRGDTWANVLVVTPEQNWLANSTYQVVLSNTIQNLYGASPAEDFAFSFTTCASPDGEGNCPVDSTPLTSGCPKTEEAYKSWPSEGSGGSGGSGGMGGAGGSQATSSSSAGGDETVASHRDCGCKTPPSEDNSSYGWLATTLGLLACARRRRRA